MAPETKEAAGGAEGGGKSFAMRDLLRSIERRVQQRWEKAEVFRAESRPGTAAPAERFFGNFPYPYMNGSLHLGHAFSLSKLKFAAAYHRLCGRNVLLPFAFHCTGMPIKVTTDKLAREIRQFDNPPVFHTSKEEPDEEEIKEEENKPDDAGANGKTAPDKFKSKRSKAVAKSGGDKYQ